MNSEMMESRCQHAPRVLDFIRNELQSYEVIESTMSDDELMKFTKLFVLKNLMDTAMIQPFYEADYNSGLALTEKSGKLFGLFNNKKKYEHSMALPQYILERFVYEIFNPNVTLQKVDVSREVLDKYGHVNRDVRAMIEYLDRMAATLKVKENSFEYDAYKISYQILKEDVDAIDNLLSAGDIGSQLNKMFKNAVRSNKSDVYLVTDWSQKLMQLV